MMWETISFGNRFFSDTDEQVEFDERVLKMCLKLTYWGPKELQAVVLVLSIAPVISLRISPDKIVVARAKSFAGRFRGIWSQADKPIDFAHSDSLLRGEPAVIRIQSSIAVLEPPRPRCCWWILRECAVKLVPVHLALGSSKQ